MRTMDTDTERHTQLHTQTHLHKQTSALCFVHGMFCGVLVKRLVKFRSLNVEDDGEAFGCMLVKSTVVDGVSVFGTYFA